MEHVSDYTLFKHLAVLMVYFINGCVPSANIQEMSLKLLEVMVNNRHLLAKNNDEMF